MIEGAPIIIGILVLMLNSAMIIGFTRNHQAPKSTVIVKGRRYQ